MSPSRVPCQSTIAYIQSTSKLNKWITEIRIGKLEPSSGWKRSFNNQVIRWKLNNIGPHQVNTRWNHGQSWWVVFVCDRCFQKLEMSSIGGGGGFQSYKTGSENNDKVSTVKTTKTVGSNISGGGTFLQAKHKMPSKIKSAASYGSGFSSAYTSAGKTECKLISVISMKNFFALFVFDNSRRCFQ